MEIRQSLTDLSLSFQYVFQIEYYNFAREGASRDSSLIMWLGILFRPLNSQAGTLC